MKKLIIAAGLCLLTFASAQALTLSGKWQWVGPVNSSGQLSGTAIKIRPVPSGYQYKPWFSPTSTYWHFQSPTKGATNSLSYTRSELAELDSTGKTAAWSLSTGGTFSATGVKIKQTPGRLVVGQIHSQTNDEMLTIMYENGVVTFQNDIQGAFGPTIPIPLNAKWNYKIKLGGGNLVVTVTYNGQTYTGNMKISSAWSGNRFFFKTGVYCITSSGPDCIVEFDSLSKTTHP